MTLAAHVSSPSDHWHIRVVESVAETEAELLVRFVGFHEPAAARDSVDFPLLRQYLSLSLEYRLPLGILLRDDRRIPQVGTVICSEIQGVSDHPVHPHVKNVELRGEAAPRYLSTQHPRFEELVLVRQIAAAAITHERLWCILQGSSIVQIKTISPEKEEELRSWIRGDGQGATREQSQRVAERGKWEMSRKTRSTKSTMAGR